MEIEEGLFKKIKYLESPNFNDRPDQERISLIVIHSISLPPNNYTGTYVEDFF
jgi:AmpD protein